MTSRELIQSLIDLQNKYAKTYRAMVTCERLGHLLARAGEVDVLREEIREPLIEHVGHLPVIASFIHPHITHSADVNLGRALVMLSIHDIGETVTGDFLTYTKTVDHETEEAEVTRKLLPPTLRTYFDEFEEMESLDAKFAKSVDAVAPFLHEISAPNLTRTRFKKYGITSQIVETKKKALFEWDPVLREMFTEIIEIYRKIERREPTGLVGGVDLTQ
jgi:putative hydrolase of HD superfamily